MYINRIIYMVHEKDIDGKLNVLLVKVNNLQRSVDKIEGLLFDIAPKCDEMVNHITFIDSVYDNVKSPLSYVCNKISMMIYNKENLIELPKKEKT